MSLKLTHRVREITPTMDSYNVMLDGEPNIEVQMWIQMTDPQKVQSEWIPIRNSVTSDYGQYETVLSFGKPLYSGYKMQIVGVDVNEVHSNIITVTVGTETPTPTPEPPTPKVVYKGTHARMLPIPILFFALLKLRKKVIKAYIHEKLHPIL